MYNGINSVIVCAPSTGEYVRITEIEASAYTFEKRPYGVENGPTGDQIQPSDQSRARVAFLDTDGSIYAKLLEWQNAETKVSMIGIGHSKWDMWQEVDRIKVRKVGSSASMANGRSDVYEFSLSRVGHGRHKIYSATNLLSHFAWIDVDDDGVADGYTSTSLGTVTYTFDDADRHQELESDSVDGIYVDLVLPIHGETFSLNQSVEVVALFTASSSFVQQVQWLDKDKSTIQSIVDVPTATGRTDQSISSIPANAFYLRVWPGVVPTASFGNMSFADPALRVDDVSTYIQS